MDGREADALRLDPCGVEIGIERSREAAVRMEGHLFEPGHGSVERIHVGVDRQLARVRVEIEPVDRDADLASLRADTAALGLPEGDIELSGEGLAVLCLRRIEGERDVLGARAKAHGAVERDVRMGLQALDVGGDLRHDLGRKLRLDPRPIEVVGKRDDGDGHQRDCGDGRDEDASSPPPESRSRRRCRWGLHACCPKQRTEVQL